MMQQEVIRLERTAVKVERGYRLRIYYPGASLTKFFAFESEARKVAKNLRTYLDNHEVEADFVGAAHALDVVLDKMGIEE